MRVSRKDAERIAQLLLDNKPFFKVMGLIKPELNPFELTVSENELINQCIKLRIREYWAINNVRMLDACSMNRFLVNFNELQFSIKINNIEEYNNLVEQFEDHTLQEFAREEFITILEAAYLSTLKVVA